jgi:hypothetical protein
MRTIHIATYDWHEIQFDVPVARVIAQAAKEERFCEQQTQNQTLKNERNVNMKKSLYLSRPPPAFSQRPCCGHR